VAEKIQHRLPLGGADQMALSGINDENLQELARLAGVRVVLRGEDMILSGAVEEIERAIPTAKQMIEAARLGNTLEVDQIRRAFGAGNGRAAPPVERAPGEPAPAQEAETPRVYLSGSRKVVNPRSEGQSEYLEALARNDIVVAIGPAGTGKTYLAVAMGIDALRKNQVKKIVLARPAVEAGENLGFLPGDLQEKVDPYLRPLYDALDDLMPADWVRRSLESRTIEIAPLAYMRGRTLGDAFVILDEAQNATREQMKMFLTRLGLNSRAVITGDKTQIDLPRREDSGLLDVERILPGIEGIGFIYLQPRDVVRHRLVKDIIDAYAAADAEVAD
jgi:phosphate starvation-inducible protein PhoH and related proteins